MTRHTTHVSIIVALMLCGCTGPNERADASAEPDASRDVAVADLAVEADNVPTDCASSVDCAAPCELVAAIDLTNTSADCKGPEKSLCVNPQARNSVCAVLHRTNASGESEVLFLPEQLTLDGWEVCGFNNESPHCVCAETLGCLP